MTQVPTPLVEVLHADALEAMRSLGENTVDAVVTDPPYGLTALPRKKVELALTRWLAGERDFIPGGRGFMNTRWDRFVPPPALWDEAFRLLKPGGFLVSFSGARTLDLMSLSIRLAGFEVRDILAWIRADSFAKAPGILKSGHEPIVMARKPLQGTLAQNTTRWGTGALNIDECRTPYRNDADEAETKTKNAHGRFGTRHGGNAVFGDFGDAVRDDYNPPGRWPSNTILDQAAADILDDQHPQSRSRPGTPRAASEPGAGWGMTRTGTEHDDIGGPSRFFTIAEAPAGFGYSGRAPRGERPTGPDGTTHPTVKPLTIMDWLVRLVTPESGLLLDPFAGSGTTAEAAIAAGRNAIVVEGNGRFIPLIDQRIQRARASLPAS